MMLARKVFAFGQHGRDTFRKAEFCPWGDHWHTSEDKLLNMMGAPTLHGICPACAAKLEAEPRHLLHPKGAA